jgi:hypothetical protein
MTDVPGIVTPKLPNSELIFQISKEQFDSVADVQFVIHHPINQQGTVAVMQAAHNSKSIAPTNMTTWTVSDGSVFFRLLGTRNGRPIAFMSANHPVDLQCRVHIHDLFLAIIHQIAIAYIQNCRVYWPIRSRALFRSRTKSLTLPSTL